jgi:tetratricopeptide (TPR) repeat protein
MNLEQRRTWLVGALVFVAMAACTLPNLNPAFNADDSPETAACAATLGIQHPPGYPLDSLLGRLGVLVLPGNPGLAVNALSALCACLACGLLAAALYLLLTRGAGLRALPSSALAQSGLPLLTRGHEPLAWLLPAAAAASGGLWLGLGRTFFSQALSAKGGVYTLQAALLAAALLLTQLWEEDVAGLRLQAQGSRLRLLNSRWALLLALVLGLSLANHWETGLLLLPALALHAVMLLPGLRLDARLGRRKAWQPLLWMLAFLLLGLSLCIYLPLRSRLNPALNWGRPDTWPRFLACLLRQEYTGTEAGFFRSLAAGDWSEAGAALAAVGGQSSRMLGLLASDMGPAWLLALLGLPVLAFVFRRSRQALMLLALFATGGLAVAFWFHLKPEMIWVMDVFLIPLYLVEALLAGVALGWLAERVRKRQERRRRAAWLRPLLAALMLSLPLAWGLKALPALSQRQSFEAWDFGRDLLGSVSQDGLLLAEGDFYAMPCYYLQQVEGRRPDLVMLTSVFLSQDWGLRDAQRQHPGLGLDLDPEGYTDSGALYRASLRRLLAVSAGRRPIASSLFQDSLPRALPETQGRWTVNGLALRLDAPQNVEQSRRLQGVWASQRSRHEALQADKALPSTSLMLSNYASEAVMLADALQGQTATAEAYYKEALRLAPSINLAEVRTHYALALAARGDLEGAQAQLKLAITVKPIYEAWSDLGALYNQQQRWAEGEAALRQALALRPNAPAASNNLALSLYRQGRKAEAQALLAQALQAHPGDRDLVHNQQALR